MVLLGMLGFTNFVLERGTIDGGLSEGGVEEGSVAEGVVGDGSFSEVDGGFGIVSVDRGFLATSGESTGLLGSIDSIRLTIFQYLVLILRLGHFRQVHMIWLLHLLH